MTCGTEKMVGSPRSRGGAEAGIRLVLGVAAALLLLAADLNSAGQDLPREFRVGTQLGKSSQCEKSICEERVARADGMIGAVDPVLGQKVEPPRPAGDTTSWRSRLDDWNWAAARLHVEVDTIIRLFGSCVLRQDNGRMADRPLILTCPAQGPPAEA